MKADDEVEETTGLDSPSVVEVVEVTGSAHEVVSVLQTPAESTPPMVILSSDSLANSSVPATSPFSRFPSDPRNLL